MKANRARPLQPKVTPATRKAASSRHILKPYVAGRSPKSVNAISNIKKLREANLQGRYVPEVIDLCQQPQLAQGEQIIAVPENLRPHCAASSAICRTPGECWRDWKYEVKRNG